jgi:PhnB protein
MEPTLTPKLAPYLAVHDAPGLIRFITDAIGGELTYETKDSSGRLAHAEVRIADGLVMIGEVPAGQRTFPGMIHLYVPDSDAACRRAIGGGATSVREPGNSGDGLRRGGVRDAWANEWWFSSPAPPP